MSKHEGKGLFWGILLVLLGTLFLLNNLGYISGDILRWWPVILIAIGLKKLMW